ncbi:MAG: ribosome biogenesis GTPase YlqF [Oscillospiraceae bacterium]|nr:ribosome biogenesis GTPase YlqF [Oscillospiraceae bacterium]
MIIQWFPGHMAKTRRLILENMKLVNAVCEVIDARIPISSRNPDIDELMGNKPRLIIFNRIDQADADMSKKWVAHFKNAGAGVIKTDCKSGKGVDALPAAARLLLSDKLAAYTQKGQTGRSLRLMVVGIPNVGKSSLINRAAGRRAAQTSDRPGVTRGKQWINIESGIELLDTPGVLWPKFEDQTVGENLAFTGAIRDEVMDIESLGAAFMSRLAQYYPDKITERYKIDIPKDAGGHELLTEAAKKRGFLIAGGEYDTLRMAVAILDEFRGGKLGRITLEEPS